MKICKAIQDRKRKQKLIQLRNLLVCEIECINTKLELLQLLLAGLNANAVTEISEEMESLECLNFRVDLVDEEPEVDLAVPEEESHLEHLANLTFGDDPITSNEILEF